MKENNNLLSLLTFDELEIMELYILGLKNEQICKRTNYSKYFLSKKVNSVIEKLNANNRIHAVSIIANEIEKQNINKPFQNIENKRNISGTLNLKFKFF